VWHCQSFSVKPTIPQSLQHLDTSPDVEREDVKWHYPPVAPGSGQSRFQKRLDVHNWNPRSASGVRRCYVL